MISRRITPQIICGDRKPETPYSGKLASPPRQLAHERGGQVGSHAAFQTSGCIATAWPLSSARFYVRMIVVAKLMASCCANIDIILLLVKLRHSLPNTMGGGLACEFPPDISCASGGIRTPSPRLTVQSRGMCASFFAL